ncbi:transposase [Streptomyces ardesiacus]
MEDEIRSLVIQATPTLLVLCGVGAETAGHLLTSAGENPEHMRSERAFEHRDGGAPIQASCGSSHCHRLNRGGDRAGSNDLHTIVMVRIRFDERTRGHVGRRAKEDLSKKDIMRGLERLLAREVHRALTSTPATHHSKRPRSSCLTAPGASGERKIP